MSTLVKKRKKNISSNGFRKWLFSTLWRWNISNISKALTEKMFSQDLPRLQFIFCVLQWHDRIYPARSLTITAKQRWFFKSSLCAKLNPLHHDTIPSPSSRVTLVRNRCGNPHVRCSTPSKQALWCYMNSQPISRYLTSVHQSHFFQFISYNRIEWLFIEFPTFNANGRRNRENCGYLVESPESRSDINSRRSRIM